MSEVFFFIKFCKILSKDPFNSFFYFLNKITKMKIKNFECPKSIHMKKNINTCLTIHLSHQPIEPAYYILHWQISKPECPTLSMNPRHPKNLKFGEGSNSACEFFLMFSVLSNRLFDKVVFDQEMFHVFQNLCYFLEGIHWFLQHGNKRNFHVLWTFQVAYHYYYNIHTYYKGLFSSTILLATM